MIEFGALEAFIFFCGVCYLYNKNRTDDMVDVISTRLQEVYGSWRMPGFQNADRNNDNPPDERLSSHELRRLGDENRRRKQQLKEMERKDLDRKLYEIKERPSPGLNIPLKPIQGLACRHCAPSNSEIQLDPIERRRDVKDILQITQHAGWRPDSSIFDWGGWTPFLAQCIRLKRYPFPQLSGPVMKDERLRGAIEQAARESVQEKKQLLNLSNNSVDNDSGDDDTDNVVGDGGVNIETNENAKKFDENSYYTEMRKQHERRAMRLVLDMRSKISDFLLRVTSWVLYKLLPCFLSGVVAHPAQIEMLKAAADKAPGAPLIYLPLHRSHLDYILVSFILLNNDLRSPIVAAGDNLKIPFFGALLRYLGAFFIKRKIDPVVGKKDVVYRTVLHTYVQHALAAGHNVEFFIEGGRTRTGKPCMPKSGVLSVIVDAFMDGTISDALLVPVSVNYERLVDGNFVHEQLGQKKKPETFRSAISAIWQILHSRYGLMRIDFNEPFSIRELVKSFNKHSHNNVAEQMMSAATASALSLQNGGNGSMDLVAGGGKRRLQHNPSSSSLYGTDCVHEEQRSLVDNIARHVVYDCASATAVMTTNAVAFLLLTRFRDGATLNVLSEALDNLRTTLEGKKDIGFTGESKDIIKYAAELLGPGLISVETRNNQEFFKPIVLCPNVIELAYYSNSLVSHFALESIMVTALQTLAKEYERKYETEEIIIKREDLYKQCLDHCDILRYEFILSKPCQSIDNLLSETLDKLKERELVLIPEVIYSEQEQRSRRLAMHFDDDDDQDSDDEYNHHKQVVENPIKLTSDGHCERLVLMSVLAPIGHTYLAVVESLSRLLDTTMVEAEFIKVCVNEITSKVDGSACRYGESISTDTIRNCIKTLEKWSVLEISSDTGVRMLNLTPLYDTMMGIQNVIQRFRKIVP